MYAHIVVFGKSHISIDRVGYFDGYLRGVLPYGRDDLPACARQPIVHLRATKLCE